MLPSPLAIAAIAVFVAVIALPTHVFDKQELNAIGRQAIAGHNTSEAIVHAFIKGVQARWPDHTVSGAPEDLEWLWFNSGGAMGSFTILHASMSEYVVVLGSALSTQGHTGRFLADDSMTMLVGEAWTTAPGVTRKEVYGAGALFLLPFGHAHQYQMPGEWWAVEYARGSIMSMLPFAAFDTLFSTVDLYNLWRILRTGFGFVASEALKGKF